jgi:hypothetical protein
MCLVWIVGCSSDDTSSAKHGIAAGDKDAGAVHTNGSNDKGGASDAGHAEAVARDAGEGAASGSKEGSSSTTKRHSDAGASQPHDDADGGTESPTGSTQTMDGDDAGASPELPESENCCVAHAKPGCNDADVQRCVCDKLDTCCSEAWTAACTYIVAEKFCQPGVRDCVCGSGDGQWQQNACCDVEWTPTCDDVGQIKCGATVGCK